MGKKKKKKQQLPQATQEEELLKTLRDSNNKEDWDKFFAIRGDESYEFLAEWTQLDSLLTAQLPFRSNEPLDPAGAPPPADGAQLETELATQLSPQSKKPQDSAGTPPPAERAQLQSELATQHSPESKEPQDYAGAPPLADGAQLESELATQKEPQDSAGAPTPTMPPTQVHILVPGCGNSKLSEHLYDAGFRNITNVDFSKVVISHMLRRNVRDRPQMKWRVLDMTSMQFEDETFDTVIDKGGLDSLMASKLQPRLGSVYLSAVKRILKAGGKYVCLTLAEAHVLDLLLPIFRFGWKMNLNIIPQETSLSDSKLNAIMVVAEKDGSTAVFDISSSMDKFSLETEALDLNAALAREKKIRLKYSNGSDIVYSLEDLLLGAKGNISELEPGRRVKLILEDPEVSFFIYNGILLDAKQQPDPFTYHYSVFFVPHNRARDGRFSSEEGQWQLVEGSKAARLLLILLDSSNSTFDIDCIQMDLSPLAKQLAPRYNDGKVGIPFLAAAAGDGFKHREIVHKATSALAGSIFVDDVIYKDTDDKNDVHKGRKFRRLIFQNTKGLVQSEAVLSTKGSNGISSKIEKNKKQKSHKHKRKASREYLNLTHMGLGAMGFIWSCMLDIPRPNIPVIYLNHGREVKVFHNLLACAYHNAIISGIMLISSHFNASTTDGGLVETVVIGLGAGLLPMFMKNNLPSLNITVLELDPAVPPVAREYFGFREDEHLKVHIADGVEYIKAIAYSEADEKNKVHILVVDVYSTDPSCGFASPETDFVDGTFLMDVKNALSEQGLFIINLVSRSSEVKESVYARLRKEFVNILRLRLEDDISEVLFAVNEGPPMNEDQLSEARSEVESSVDWCLKVVALSKLIEPLDN